MTINSIYNWEFGENAQDWLKIEEKPVFEHIGLEKLEKVNSAKFLDMSDKPVYGESPLSDGENVEREIKKIDFLTHLVMHRFENQGKLNLRINQLQAITALEEKLNDKDWNMRGYFVMPTGSGKTILMGQLCKSIRKPHLILVPKINLLKQTKNALVKDLGISEEEIGIIGGGERVLGKRITISTYQSHVANFNSGNGYLKFLAGVEVIHCDEAHKSLGEKTAESLDFDLTVEEEQAENEVLNQLRSLANSAMVLGYTATPDLAQKSVDKYYGNSEIARVKYSGLVRAGILVPFSLHHTEGQASKVNLTEEEEVEVLEKQDIYRKLLGLYKKLVMEKGPLKFAVNCVNTAECLKFMEIAENEFGFRSRRVTTKDDDDALEKAENELSAGLIDFVVSVDKLTEGWDFPPLDGAIVARGTSSPARLIQFCGRAARTFVGKEVAHIIETDWRVSRDGSDGEIVLDEVVDEEADKDKPSTPGLIRIGAKSLNLLEAFLRNGEDLEGLQDLVIELNGQKLQLELCEKMDVNYFENTDNIRKDLQSFALAVAKDIESLYAYHIIGVEILSQNAERISGSRYLTRAAKVFGIAEKAVEAQSKGAEIFNFLKKKIGIEEVAYKKMDATYFAYTNQLKSDMAEVERVSGVAIDKLNLKQFLSIEIVAGNGEKINMRAYLARLAISLNLAKDSSEAEKRRREIFESLKLKLGFQTVEGKKLDLEYFSNLENLKKDFENLAKLSDESIEMLSMTNLRKIEITCQNGEKLNGRTYVSKAAIILGLAKDSIEAGKNEAVILKTLKEKIGYRVTKEMDAVYFNNSENIEKDLKIFANQANVSMSEMTVSNIVGIEAFCQNNEKLTGRVYLTRAGIYFGLAKGSVEAKSKAKEILNFLKAKIGQGNEIVQELDITYFQDIDKVRKDLALYAQKSNVTIEELRTGGNLAKEVLCQNNETILGRTYICRAGVALGLAKDTTAAARVLKEILIALKKSIGVTVLAEMDKTYFGNIGNIRKDLNLYAQALGKSVEQLNNLKDFMSVEVICQNGEKLKGQTYLVKAAIGLGMARGSVEAKGLRSSTLEILKEKAKLALVDETIPTRDGLA